MSVSIARRTILTSLLIVRWARLPGPPDESPLESEFWFLLFQVKKKGGQLMDDFRSDSDRRDVEDRRLGIDRRQSSMPIKLERRRREDRRTEIDRRSGLDRRLYSTFFSTI